MSNMALVQKFVASVTHADVAIVAAVVVCLPVISAFLVSGSYVMTEQRNSSLNACLLKYKVSEC